MDVLGYSRICDCNLEKDGYPLISDWAKLPAQIQSGSCSQSREGAANEIRESKVFGLETHRATFFGPIVAEI